MAGLGALVDEVRSEEELLVDALVDGLWQEQQLFEDEEDELAYEPPESAEEILEADAESEGEEPYAEASVGEQPERRDAREVDHHRVVIEVQIKSHQSEE